MAPFRISFRAVREIRFLKPSYTYANNLKGGANVIIVKEDPHFHCRLVMRFLYVINKG